MNSSVAFRIGWTCLASLALTGVGCAQAARPAALSASTWGAVQPQDVQWRSFPALPSPVQMAVIVGEPQRPGPFVIRVKVPEGARILPHVHPETRIYTVISGTFYIGIGEKFDPDGLKAYGPGSVLVLPGNTPHYHWARSGEYVSQISADGPLGIRYINSLDDPRVSEAR